MTAGGVKRAVLHVRVVPRAARAALTRDQAGRWRAHVTAPPIDGAANRALVALLADRLGLPKRAFALLRGERGRDKIVAVEGRRRRRSTRGSATSFRALTKRRGVASSDRNESGGIMPIYEYHCRKCGDFEIMQKMSDKPLTTCPTVAGR